MTYEPKRELKRMFDELSKLEPPLKEYHYVVLRELRVRAPDLFFTNRTRFFLSELKRHAMEVKIFRVAHMGDTRGGKSNGALLNAFFQVWLHNSLLARGVYDSVDVDIPKKPVTFGVKNVHENKAVYAEAVRQELERGELVYGTVSVIDEERENTGGLGSMTEEAEALNLNNITAKYHLGEQWVYPRGILSVNANYAIHWMIKDIKRRVNWGLLYKMEARSSGVAPENFLGWVCFPVHENEEFRREYEEKKNAWIRRTVSRTGDPRSEARAEAAKVVAANKLFAERRSPLRFVLNHNQQLDVIDEMTARGEIPAFNAHERSRIADAARLIALRTEMTENAQKPRKSLKASASKKKS